ncbi:MAG: NAD-dependent epimerase/dehydratase family protein [Bacteroidetes bacterium]|nr:NAD-dependent epimerase/dehydratase family protein [Bacteroidota bacterium]
MLGSPKITTMRILLTGASGFLGHFLYQELSLSHEVVTVGRAPGNHICTDLSSTIPSLPVVDMVVHAAGKAHVVPKTDKESKAFFDVNVQGTRHLLEGLDKHAVRPNTLIYFSTVAVYGLESGTDISEDSPILGGSSYADSKIAAEQLLKQWGAAWGVQVLMLRIPLIAGKGAPGNLGAMVQALRRGYYFRIGEGSGRKSMVNATDLARFIPSLHGKAGTYNLTDGHHPSLAELDSLLAAQLGRNVHSIPNSLADGLAWLGDRLPGFPINTYRLEKLRRHLTFSDAKARRELGWSPQPVLSTMYV